MTEPGRPRLTRPARRLALVLLLLTGALSLTTGAAQAADATLSASTINFGQVHLDTTVTAIEKVTVSKGYQISSVNGAVTEAPYGIAESSACAEPGPVTCTIAIGFTPDYAGPYKDHLTIDVCLVGGNDTCYPHDVTVSATALSPVTASPSSYSFGNVPVGVTSRKAITLSLDPGWSLSRLTTSPENGEFDPGQPTPGCTLAGPGDCTVTAAFAPTRTGPASTKIFVLVCPAGDHPCSEMPIPVTGTGTRAASLNPTSVSFGSLHAGRSVAKNVVVHVYGAYHVERVSAAGSGGGRFDTTYDSDTCSLTGPRDCNVLVSFTPYQAGVEAGTLSVLLCPYTNTNCELDSIPLTGTGQYPGTVSPTSISFPSTKVGASSAKPEKVTLDPGWYVEGASVVEHNGETTNFSADTSGCPASGTCTFNATFAPVAIGALKGTMYVTVCETFPAPGQPCVDLPGVALSGTGVAPGTLSSSSLSFGSVPVYQSKALGFSATLDHGWSVASFEGTGTSDPYAVRASAPCVRTTNGSNLCRLAETFAPQYAGLVNAATYVVICQDNGSLCVQLPPVKDSGTGTLTATTTKLTSSATRVFDNQQVNLTAGVTPAPDLGPDPGTVTFYDGTRPIAGCYQVPLASDDFGRYFSYCSTTLPAGQHSVKAVYSGTPGYKTSTSSAITITSTHLF